MKSWLKELADNLTYSISIPVCVLLVFMYGPPALTKVMAAEVAVEATEPTNYLGWISLSVFVLMLAYIIAILMYSKSGLNTFYVALPANRFAFVTKGGEVIRIIYNSARMKLIKADGFPMGKFVPRDPSGKDPDELQKLGPIEEWLGVWYVGIPFVHGLLGKKLHWISPDDPEFKEKKDEVFDFAITKTFGYNLQELTLGKTKKTRGATDRSQASQGILVDIKLTTQVTIVDPYKAIIETDWMAGTESALTRNVQSTLGGMDQDKLIAQKSTEDNKKCKLVQNILDDLDPIQAYGVEFDRDKIVYKDYSVAGDADQRKKINDANTKKFEEDQRAAGIRAVKRAEQEDMLVLQEIVLDLIKKLVEEGTSKEEAQRTAREMLRTRALTGTPLNTLVEGGARVQTSIQAGQNDKRNGGKKPS